MEKICPIILSQIPDTIDFDFITIKTQTTKSIYLNNTSSQNILFRIETDKTFFFEPNGGIIPSKKKLEVKIKINPDLAKVLVSNARIILENKYTKIIKLSYVAKYPFLHINKSHIEFGSIQIGKTLEKELVISNLELVPAYFTIEHKSAQPGKQPCAFYISDLSGNIPPKSNFLLKILYKPIFPSSNSLEIFTISTKGGNKLTFECKGTCRPLKTWIGTKSVNFKSIPLGSQMKKLFRIYNDSDIATEFQIYHDNSGAFAFDVTEGIIPAKSNIRINATFRPYETIVYYQRIFCLIKNHMIFPIDLFGSCHNLLTKTPLIDYNKIEMFRYKELKGIFFSKEKNKKIIFDGLSKPYKTLGEGEPTLDGDKNANEVLDDFKDINKINMKQPQLHKEMFWECDANTRLISFDKDFIDFNFMESGSVSEPYVLTVFNNSNQDMNVKFIFEKPINLNNLISTINIFHSENTVFFTQPEEQIILKQSSAEFKVYFKPNRKEYYFFTNLPCQATIINESEFNYINNSNINPKKSRNKLININKNKLSEFGKEMLDKHNTEAQKTDFLDNNLNKKQSLLNSYLTLEKGIEKKNINKKYSTLTNSVTNSLSQTNNQILEPPITLYIPIVGHSFPPGTQIFMPMFEFNPKKEIFFPPTSINQSLYQSLKIKNKSDTPLFYKIKQDPQNIFRVHNKYGLIPANSFHLICLEFSPKDTTVYRYPLNIEFNHDVSNTKVIMLNGLCTDPVIDIEGAKNEMYFAPCYVGIRTKKSIIIKNLSPIHIKVDIKIDKMINGILEVDESNFELDLNAIKKIEFSLIPQKNEEISAHVLITAERVYDPSEENIGVYNPFNSFNKKEFDKRIFSREINVLGLGSDGDIRIEPEKLEFGTVKVGFHKKLSFSIFNPTITNFYLKLVPDFSGNTPLSNSVEEEKDAINYEKKRKDIKIDFTEGMINSLCKKDINIQFEPITRVNLNFRIKIYATDTLGESKKILIKKEKSFDMNNNNALNDSEHVFNDNEGQIFEHREELKCSVEVSAKGDYPLIKIVDLRNNLISPAKLWKEFNVDKANEELQKKLTDLEMNYSNANADKKISDITQTLKIINFNFGKNFLSKNKSETQNLDVFLTLRNEGGVLTEFYFKFPDDINIKREIWMDPVEPTSNDKIEYHVLKEQIFTIEPKKSKLSPGECCNIRLRYSIKEKGKHRLRVLFQVVNGKPLIFELLGETLSDKNGILILPKEELNFGEMPIGCMCPMIFPFEIKNLSSIKTKYIIDKTKISKYNELNHGFEIFKMDNTEGTIGPNENKYLNTYFRPLADIEYKLVLNLFYTDDVTANQINFCLKGKGYHPFLKRISNYKTSFENMPNRLIYKYFNNYVIQKCGLSIEDLNFGIIDNKKNKTFILYNYSKDNSYNFDFNEPGFLIKDKLQIFPHKGTVEPGHHKIIKCFLSPDPDSNNNYEGDVLIKISWNQKNSNKILNNIDFSPGSANANKQNKSKRNTAFETSNNPILGNIGSNNRIERENLYLRVSKRGNITDNQNPLNGNFNLESNSCFIEQIIIKLVKEIFKDKEFTKLFKSDISNQPLSLYQWTTNTTCSTLKETRKKFLKKLQETINRYFYDLSAQVTKRSIIRSDLRGTTHKNTSNRSSMKMESDIGKIKYDTEMENKIEEKYLKEIGDKYKYSINEMNEKIVILNHETKKAIIDIAMENTLFNIVSEAANGEYDLTEKQRIYFFLDQGMKPIDDNSNINSNQNNNKNNIINENKEENKNEENDNKNNDEEKK